MTSICYNVAHCTKAREVINDDTIPTIDESLKKLEEVCKECGQKLKVHTNQSVKKI